MKRVTTSMVKDSMEGKLNKKDLDEIVKTWFDEFEHGKINDILDKKAEYIMDQFAGALLMDGLEDSARIEIIRKMIGLIAEVFVTPKAWELLKNEIKDDFNKEYKLDTKKKCVVKTKNVK